MPKKPGILFRTIGGRSTEKQIGLGHIYRCINLAKKLKNYRLYFLVEDYGGANKIIKNSGFNNIHVIKKNSSINSDFKITEKFIKKNNIGLVIVDKYKIKLQYLTLLKKIINVVVISDLQKIDFPANLVINGFIGFKNLKMKNKFNTTCLLGPKYQILNEKFSKIIHTKNQKEFTLLATFGGLDGHNISEKMYNPLSKYGNKIKTKIILGPIAKKSHKLINLQREFKESIKIIQKTDNMYYEISNSSFGLSSGGLTTYEFASLGVPFGIVSQVRHQLHTAKEWEKLGLATNLGLVGKNTSKKIEDFIENIVTGKILKKKTRIVDGLGSERVAKEIVKLIQLDKY